MGTAKALQLFGYVVIVGYFIILLGAAICLSWSKFFIEFS